MNIHREEAGEESAPYLCLRQLSKDVNIRLSEPLTGDGSSSASVPTNMFCVASSQRLAAASTRNGINIYDLHVLRNTFTQAERNASPSPPVLCTLPLQPGTGDVLFVMFGNSDSLLLAATSHGLILIWETMSLRSSPPAPRTVAPPRHDASRVHMIAPNPGDKSSLCAVVYGMDLLSLENGSAHMLDLLKGEWVNILPAHNVTSVSWSARGKQLVLGVKTGEIIQFTPEGDVKAVLPPPESDRPLYVEDVQWLENHVFLVTYNTCSSTPEPEPIHENEVYVLYRDAKSNSLTFAAFPYDVSPPFGDRTRWGYRYTCMLRDWSPMKHFVFMTCSASTDVGVLGFKDGWKALVLEETSRPVLPFLSGDDFCDSSPMALALDLTAEDPVPDPNAAEKGEDPSATLPATPILYIYTNDGVLLGYHVIYTETDKPYPGMITGQGAISHSPNASTNVSASIPPAFAESVHGSTTPNRTPTFGSTSAFGAVSQPAFGSTSAFGQQSSFGSAFSNGSPFSKFSASGATAFGGGNALGQKQMPASGQSTQPPSGPAPGQSSEPAFGSTSAFGQLQKPTFGAASTFARAQKPITGSNSAFGQFSQQGTASGLGPTAFSALSNKQNAFGSVSSQGSVFGSGGSFDTGKPAFASVTPAPKALPKSEEPVDEDAPKDSTFSFGGLSDMLSKSNTPMSSQPSANLNLSHQAKFPSEISQNSEPSKATPSVLSESSSKASQNDSDNLEKAESQNFENLESAIVDAKQDEAHEGNFASLHDTPTVQKSEQADEVTFDLFKGKQENQTSSFNESGEGIKETEISPIKAAGNNLDASLSTLAKPSEEKPKEPAFSIAKPSDEKPKESTSVFAQPTEKPKESAFSFSKPFEEKPKESAFSFAKPTAEKPKESAFTFNKPSEEKAKQTAFSFNKPFEEKPKESAFSFNKPSEEKPKVPAFSFAKPPEEKPKESTFSFAKPSEEKAKEPALSFAKPTAENLKESAFSFNKPSEEKPKESAFSFAKLSEEKAKEPAFSFAKPTAENLKESAFSFAKPVEEKPKESAFFFNKPSDEKPKEPAFSFNKPSEEKPKVPAFSFNKPFEEKPKEAAFSFNKPSEEKPKESAFSFTKPSDEKPKEPAFSFAKPVEEKPKESAFSFNKPSEEKPKEPAFSFAKPVEEKPKESAFSFAKPPEEKLEKNKTTGSDTEVFSHKASPERLIESQKLSKGSEFGTNHAAEPSSNALVDNELPAIGVSLAESVPQIDLTQVADPNVPKEDDELKQEFVKIYAILEEELRTLRRQTKQSTDFFTRLRIPSTSPKSVDDLSNADAWVFGDVQSLSSLTSEFLQAVIESEDQVAETRKHIASIESVQLKSEVKREEIARFLRARQDPDFAKMVRVRHLGPEQLENQTRLRRSSHLVRERLSELGEYFNGLQKSTLNAKQGQTTLRAPTLDTIYRSADNIGRLVSARIRELDKMGQDVDAAVPRSTVRARTPHSPARPLDNMADLDTALPEVSEITGINQAGMMHDICDAIWESKKTPVVTRASQTKFISSVPYQMSPIVLHCSQAPTCQKAPVQESDKGKQSETLVMTEPSTKNFLATATPNGIHAHSPMQPRQKVTSAFQRLSTLPTLTSHSNPTSSAQYTTFEGLVGPQPTASSETRDLTLEEFIAQDEEDNGDYTEEESYEDFDDDLEDEEEEEEANESDAS
ncbi:Nucleoporin nup146 [Malassezia restricta CBS 7877]|uniref:Nucleoporin nup146 n=1 Tax=Malassezia restricta (strain ATCC 96810 / NBRC 103918 / CBS 7877) TaxID=425264 RepID=A0A3G2SA95_MALR7|nr:Nucleoporin nup146 [Malassezia restricta CBS 7877]